MTFEKYLEEYKKLSKSRVITAGELYALRIAYRMLELKE